MANEYILKEYLGSSVATTLATTITNVSTSIVLTAGATFPTGASAPFVIVLDPGTATEEKVLCTSRSVNTLTVLNRGYDGTSAQAHTAGAVIQHVLDAYSIQHAIRIATGKTETGGATTTGFPFVSNGTSLPAYQALTNAGVASAAAIAHTKMGAVPRAMVYRNAVQSIPNAANTALLWNTELTDDLGFHDPSTNTSRLTVPAGYGGVYLVDYAVEWASSSGAGVRASWIAVNGDTSNRWAYHAPKTSSSTDAPAISSAGAIALGAGDYIEVYVYQESTAALNLGGATITTHFGLTYIGPSA